MSKEFKVGLFALITGVILYTGFNYLKGIEFFSNTNKYYAIYDNVDGLNISNPVVVNGFSVGRVSRITIMQNNGNRVLVEIDVSENIALNDSTVATLANSDFLGSKAILLKIGKSPTLVNDGDTITAAVDKGLAEILERAQPLTDNLGVTITRINEILLGMEGTGGEIKQTVEGLNKAIKNVNGLISENRNSLKTTLNYFQILSKNLNSKMDKLDPIIIKVDSSLTKINNLEVEKTLANVNHLLENLSSVIDGINSGNGTLGKIMQNDSLYNNLNKAMIDLDKLLIHFNENPKHFMAPLGKSKKKIAKEMKGN